MTIVSKYPKKYIQGTETPNYVKFIKIENSTNTYFIKKRKRSITHELNFLYN